MIAQPACSRWRTEGPSKSNYFYKNVPNRNWPDSASTKPTEKSVEMFVSRREYRNFKTELVYSNVQSTKRKKASGKTYTLVLRECDTLSRWFGPSFSWACESTFSAEMYAFGLIHLQIPTRSVVFAAVSCVHQFKCRNSESVGTKLFLTFPKCVAKCLYSGFTSHTSSRQFLYFNNTRLDQNKTV